MHLNKEQQDVVLDHHGIISVVAGPGSGKTRVLIERIDSILRKNKGIKPWEILVISFTNKVKQEIKARLYLKNPFLEGVEVHTFHTFAIKYLKIYADYVGLPKNFMILDEEGENTLVEEVYERLQMDKKIIKIREMVRLIDLYSNNTHSEIPDSILLEMPKISELYSEIKKSRGYLSFDDLLIYANLLLHSSAGSVISSKLKFVMVDEAQDLNDTQFKFVSALQKIGIKNILLVGDLDQAIYEWRGAAPELFKSFYSSSKKHVLKINYRSTPNIIDKSNKLIKHNLNRVDVEFNTVNENHTEPYYKMFNYRDDEIKFVGSKIKELITSGIKPCEIAILYRSNYLSSTYERALMQNHIDYVIYNGTEFYNRREIKDTLALLKVIYNHSDELSWKRILLNIEGFGKVAFKKIQEIPAVSFFDKIYTALKNKKIAKKHIEVMENLLFIYEEAFKSVGKVKYSNITNTLFTKLNLEKCWSDENYEDRIENYKELLRLMDESFEDGKSLEEYIDNISLYTNQDENKNRDLCVKLMTMHSSKGLEFENVFIVATCDGIIPSDRSLQSDNGLEQERRLMYVAMTRAKKHLYLLASPVWQWGNINYSRASRFISEAGIV